MEVLGYNVMQCAYFVSFQSDLLEQQQSQHLETPVPKAAENASSLPGHLNAVSKIPITIGNETGGKVSEISFAPASSAEVKQSTELVTQEPLSQIKVTMSVQ